MHLSRHIGRQFAVTVAAVTCLTLLPAWNSPHLTMVRWSPSSHVYHARSSSSSSSSGGVSRPSSSYSSGSSSYSSRPSSSYGGSSSGGINRPSAAPSSVSSGGIARPSVAPTTASTPSSASSGGINRPSPATATTSGGINRPGATANGGGTALPRNASPVDQAIARGHSATTLAQFRAEQAQYKAPPIGAPASRQAAQASPVWHTYGSRWNSANDYYAARQRAMAQMPPTTRVYWTSPPVYVVSARPSYGGFSGAFLGSLLAVGIVDGMMNHSYADWAYSHHNDPSYQQWYADMQAQAQDNADLRARLAVLNAQVAQLQAQHAPISNALPDGVDPSLVVAQGTVLAATAKPGIPWGDIAMYTLLAFVVCSIGAYVTMRRRRIV